MIQKYISQNGIHPIVNINIYIYLVNIPLVDISP